MRPPYNPHRRAPVDPFDGILLVDKPSGPTSHDVVDRIRRQFRLDKVGHGGTLDPQATGLLVLLIGKATKLSGQFMSSDKTYEGCMRLGIATDSHDAQGKIVSEADPSGITLERLEAEMAKFRGDIMQTPPMVSAVKKDGVPLYKLARKGREVEREAKLVHIYEFVVLRHELPRVFFRLRCTKGTYVRTICHDIGQGLGCGANLDELRRTQSGSYRVEDAATTAVLLDLDLAGLRQKVIPIGAIPLQQRDPG